jgi:CheY-like chemotaxis protein
VDDDDICLFIHRRVLELSGYSKSTYAASNGKRAIDFLQQSTTGRVPLPDVILLDLDMPLMNGISFLEAFRLLECPEKSRIAIVLLSSTVSDEDKAHAMALGAAKCLSKPLTEEALHSMIGSLRETKRFPALTIPKT